MPYLSIARPVSSKGGEQVRTHSARTAGWLPIGLASGALVALALGVASATMATSPSPFTVASGINTVTYSIPTLSLSGTATTIASPNGAWHAAIGSSRWINPTGNWSYSSALNRTTRYESTLRPSGLLLRVDHGPGACG